MVIRVQDAWAPVTFIPVRSYPISAPSGPTYTAPVRAALLMRTSVLLPNISSSAGGSS